MLMPTGTFGKLNKIDRSKLLPVLHALQGHPESGKLWESRINSILFSPELNFKCTIHDRTIYSTTFRGVKVLLLCQVDDFALACPDKDIAKAIYDIIGKRLTLPGEDKPPFAYMGLVDDCNGVQVEQSSHFVSISAGKYTNHMLKTHGWDKPSPHEANSEHKAIPFSAEVVPSLYKEQGHLEDTQEHADLAHKQGFSYSLFISWGGADCISAKTRFSMS